MLHSMSEMKPAIYWGTNSLETLHISRVFQPPISSTGESRICMLPSESVGGGNPVVCADRFQDESIGGWGAPNPKHWSDISITCVVCVMNTPPPCVTLLSSPLHLCFNRFTKVYCPGETLGRTWRNFSAKYYKWPWGAETLRKGKTAVFLTLSTL